MKISLPFLGSLAAVVISFGAFGGCSSEKSDSNGGKTCEPGKEYHCQCVNKDEGTHVCNDDGVSFAECLPCYGDQVIGDDDIPYVPPTDDDGSSEEPDADAGDASTSPPGCGNGVVETGEQCDDKNTKANDGCSATCTVEGKVLSAGVGCPGLPVHVWDTAVKFDSTTSGFSNVHTITPYCGGAGTGSNGGTTLDRTFAVTAHKSGTLTVATIDSTFNVLLYHSSNACSTTNPMSYDGCAYKTGTKDQSVSFAVTSGTTYTVVVDSSFSGQGTFTVSFEIK